VDEIMEVGDLVPPVTTFDHEDPYKVDKLFTIVEDVAPTPAFPYASYQVVTSSSES
jgi:hypothetical protein